MSRHAVAHCKAPSGATRFVFELFPLLTASTSAYVRSAIERNSTHGSVQPNQLSSSFITNPSVCSGHDVDFAIEVGEMVIYASLTPRAKWTEDDTQSCDQQGRSEWQPIRSAR